MTPLQGDRKDGGAAVSARERELGRTTTNGQSDTETVTATQTETDAPSIQTEYRVYKRRFFGLAQLVLLNIIVSWDVSRNINPEKMDVNSQLRTKRILM